MANGNGEVSTTELLEFLQENMLTKEDAKDFATKEDLKAFVTKNEFNEGLGKLKHDLLDAMDDKMANLKGDLIVSLRKGDKKLVELVKLLEGKHVISQKEADTILSLEPFPQM